MISLRKVDPEDVDILFAWANDNEVRANAIHTKSITWDEHMAWFAKKISDKNSFMFVLCSMQEKLGIIRFDKGTEGYIITYAIDKNQRGQGYGSLIVKMGIEKLREMVDNPVLLAYVKKGNIASEIIFKKLGFTIVKKEIIQDAEFCIFKK